MKDPSEIIASMWADTLADAVLDEVCETCQDCRHRDVWHALERQLSDLLDDTFRAADLHAASHEIETRDSG